MGTKPEGFKSSQHCILDRFEDGSLAYTLAEHSNRLLDIWRDTDEPSDHAAWKAARAQLQVEHTRLRDAGVADGSRVFADIVSHISADGVPDTSTDEGAAYWIEVGEAAAQGVPNVFGSQR